MNRAILVMVILLCSACAAHKDQLRDRISKIATMHADGHLTADEAIYEIQAEIDLLEIFRENER